MDYKFSFSDYFFYNSHYFASFLTCSIPPPPSNSFSCSFLRFAFHEDNRVRWFPRHTCIFRQENHSQSHLLIWNVTVDIRVEELISDLNWICHEDMGPVYATLARDEAYMTKSALHTFTNRYSINPITVRVENRQKFDFERKKNPMITIYQLCALYQVV